MVGANGISCRSITAPDWDVLRGAVVTFSDITNITAGATGIHVDQHATVRVPVNLGANTLRIRLKDDFGLSLSQALPELGSS